MIIPGFTKTYGRNRVLNFPGMEFTPGKIYGVLGANGSGKSIFSKILAGIVPADEKLAPVSQAESAKKGKLISQLPLKNLLIFQRLRLT